MNYERLREWEEKAEKEPSKVLGWLSASHEEMNSLLNAHLGRCAHCRRAIWKTMIVGFVIAGLVIASLHGPDAVAEIMKAIK